MTRALIFVVMLSFIAGCFRTGPKEGGLYYTKGEKGDFSVLKILKVDDKGVHVRLYSNRYSSPPKKLEESSLYMAGMNRKPGEELGMGHLPLSKASFAGWKATYFQQSSVSEAELDGYRIWQEGGGYF